MVTHLKACGLYVCLHMRFKYAFSALIEFRIPTITLDGNIMLSLIDLIWVFIMTYRPYKYTVNYTNFLKVIECSWTWLHYEVDYVSININFWYFDDNKDTAWLHTNMRIHCDTSPFWIMFILQNVLNWSLECERQFFGIMFEIARKRLDKRLRPTLYLLLLTNVSFSFLRSVNVFAPTSGVSMAYMCSVMVS